MPTRGKKRVQIGGKRTCFDYALLFIIIFLTLFGLVMLYSASSYEASIKGLGATYYLKKQALASSIGIAAMAVVTMIDYRVWKRFALAGYLISIVLILLVLTPLGIEYNGAKRWIGVGSFSFQPAEFAKLAVIIFLAFVISKIGAEGLSRFRNVVLLLLLAGVIAGLLAVVTSNLSSALIVFGIAFVMLFVASPKVRYFLLMGAAGVGAVAAFIVFGDGFRMSRIQAWLDPEGSSLDTAYQTLQGLYAIGSGGLTGKGLGNSVQKLGFVPEAQNDFIFTIICEELGLFGAVSVIVIFAFMLFRFHAISKNAPDLFGSMLLVGILAHIAIQVVLNIAVVTNSIPNTGVTLPFISYGGTSVVFLMIEMGLALSVSRQTWAR
ncbi:MAG: putative lipid II flippase FtsW [Lachnospiraceae bacterium]|nr:putative lipid II flippase FtsW [Lachnospiraceae bacterium]